MYLICVEAPIVAGAASLLAAIGMTKDCFWFTTGGEDVSIEQDIDLLL